MPIVLASGSPRRRELLAALGVQFRVFASDTDESFSPGYDPEAQAIALATHKARAVAANLDEGLVLGADTIVVLDGAILGKPVDDAEAATMLRRLQGRKHRVITGITLVDAATGASDAAAVTSTVRLRPLDDEAIATYIATSEPRDKAGAYAIQGLGARLIEDFGGCYSNIVGLPLCEVSALLTAAGVVLPPECAGCRLPDGTSCPRTV